MARRFPYRRQSMQTLIPRRCGLHLLKHGNLIAARDELNVSKHFLNTDAEICLKMKKSVVLRQCYVFFKMSTSNVNCNKTLLCQKVAMCVQM